MPTSRRSVTTLVASVAVLTVALVGPVFADKPADTPGNGPKKTTTTTSTTTTSSSTTSSTTTTTTTSSTTSTTTTTQPTGSSDWADADTATIHPGVQTVTRGQQCTANFVFTSGKDVYLGQAAHCSGNSGSTATNGCDQSPAPMPVGTPVSIQGASRAGTLAYSSWNAMIAAGETDGDACRYNDFALVRVDPVDHDRVNPSLPIWGGPTGIGRSSTLSSVYSTGNSGLRFGLLKPRTGVTLTSSPWSYSVYTATPGIPGDSGSAVLNADGEAMGVLVTVALTPFAGSNGITDIAAALAYARAHGFPQLELVDGTEPFDPSLLNLATL